MQAETKIADLQLIATELKKDSRIANVHLEYLGYLSVVINESTDQGVSFGYDPEDYDTDLYWNDFGAFSGNWHNGLKVNGNFPRQETPSQNARILLTQLEEAGYLK